MIAPPGSEYLPALSSRLIRQWWSSCGSTRTRGRSTGTSSRIGWIVEPVAQVVDRRGDGVGKVDRLALKPQRPASTRAMSSRLATKRLSRSASDDQPVGQRRIEALASRRPDLAGRGEDRRQAACADRGSPRRARRRAAGRAPCSCETVAISATRLIRSSASAAWSMKLASNGSWSERTGSPPSSLRDAEDAKRAAAGDERLEQPFRRGQACPNRGRPAAMVHRPIGGGDLDRLQRIVRRAGGGERRARFPGQQQHGIDAEQAGNFARRASGRAPPRSRGRPASARSWRARHSGPSCAAQDRPAA